MLPFKGHLPGPGLVMSVLQKASSLNPQNNPNEATLLFTLTKAETKAPWSRGGTGGWMGGWVGGWMTHLGLS